MTHPNESIDELVEAYLQAIDRGDAPDWEQFVGHCPELREEFQKFVQRSMGLQTLAELGKQTADDGTAFSSSVKGESLVRVPTEFGDYEILRKLGQGGMGVVYVARHTTSNQLVALKMLRDRVRDHAMHQERLLREAIAVTALKHSHVVPIMDSGVIDDTIYLATQLVDGIGLDEALLAMRSREWDANSAADSYQPPDTPVSQTPGIDCVALLEKNHFKQVARLAADIADAVDAAHQNKVVHRDVKPSNILLDIHGKVWLTDFGLAAIGDDFSELTETGDVLGTPAYMSPEQAGGKGRNAIDHRTDIYSLGVTLFELATLRKPFVGSRHQIMLDVLRGQVPLPSRLAPAIPSQLEAIICTAMSPNPRNRYSTAGEMARDLRRFVSGNEVAVKLPSALTRLLWWCERNPVVSSVAALGVFLALGVAFGVQAYNAVLLRNLNRQLDRSNQNLIVTNDQLVASERRLSRELYIADMAAAFESYNQRNIPFARSFLERYTDNDVKDDPRGTPWYLLNQLTASPVSQVLCKHDGPAKEVVLSSDFKFGLSCGDDGLVRRFNLQSLPKVAGFRQASAASAREETGGEGDVLDAVGVSDDLEAAFHIGGKLDALALVGDDSRFITGKNIPVGMNPVNCFLTSSGDKVGHGIELGNSVESIAVSPDGKLFAAADRYQDVVVYDLHGKIHARWNTGSRNESLEFIDSRRVLAVIQEPSRFRRMEIWDIGSDEKRRLDCPFGVENFALARTSVDKPPSRVLAASGDDLCLLDFRSGEVIAVEEDIPGRIRCLDISQDGEIVVAGCDEGAVFCWNLNDRSRSTGLPLELRSIQASDQRICDITLVPKRAANSDKGIAFVTAADDGKVQYLELPQENPRSAKLSAFTSPILDPNHDRSFYLPSGDGTIRHFDVRSLRETIVAKIDGHIVGSGVVDPRTERLFVAVQDGIAEIDLQHARERRRLPVDDGQQSCVDMVIVGGQLWACFNNHVVTYDLATGKQHDVYDLPSDDAIQILSIPDDAAALVLTSDVLCRVESGGVSVIERAPSAGRRFVQARLSRDGALLATAHQNHSIRVRSVSEQQQPILLLGHQSDISSLQFLDENQILLSGSYDETLRFWDLKSDRMIGKIGPVKWAARQYVLPNESTIINLHGLGFISIWRYGTNRP